MSRQALKTFPGRLGLQQRVLPRYRVAFFDALAQACDRQLSVYAGSPRTQEAIPQAEMLNEAHFHHGRNLHLFRTPFYVCWQLDLIAWLRNWNPDALIMEANPRYPVSRHAIDWMHARGRPVLGWSLGAPELQGAFGSMRTAVRKRFVNRFDVMIAYSERGAQEFVRLGYPLDRIVVAANAVAPPPKAQPKRPPLKDRPARLIFVGRLQARKRVDLLLRACAELERSPGLTIVGDGPERAALEALARQVFPSARFSGVLFGDTLQAELDAADLLILPGTGGLAVQQAMASGLPVIVAEGDGTQQDLVSGGNGWLIPPGDLTALVAAVRSAVDHPERLVEMGRRSYNLAVEQFNIEVMRDRFVHALSLAREVI
ncbi:MAG: glycosyltransferase [Anaerolineales bacterium]|nr:MAG: glycosyltransferase [Anaerolineales bacterium]